MARDKVSTDILWKDRKRILFLGLPWSLQDIVYLRTDSL